MNEFELVGGLLEAIFLAKIAQGSCLCSRYRGKYRQDHAQK